MRAIHIQFIRKIECRVAGPLGILTQSINDVTPKGSRSQFKMPSYMASPNKSQYTPEFERFCVRNSVYTCWLAGNSYGSDLPDKPTEAVGGEGKHVQIPVGGTPTWVHKTRYERLKAISKGDIVYMNGSTGLWRGSVQGPPQIRVASIADSTSTFAQLSAHRKPAQRRHHELWAAWYTTHGIENSLVEVVVPIQWELLEKEATDAQKMWCGKHATMQMVKEPFPL